MIESAGNQLNQNTINRHSNRLKVENKGTGESRKSTTVEADSVETSRKAGSSNRPTSEPIIDKEEAAEIIRLTGNLLLGNTGGAESAQGNLNPDSVLELIA